MSIEVKNYISEIVEEELYADSNVIPANSATPVKVADGSIRSGNEGVVVSVACSQDVNVKFYLNINGKEYYPNGLNTAGLGGLTEETLLLVKIPEKGSWKIGFTNKSASDITVNWRFRIRLFKK
ncbi:MAG: hypothetical protein NC827_05970 [Candidatus Omnitrophica bacterium]|nr:hypothetical protein [Candidatus Omnitrophota bacterium]